MYLEELKSAVDLYCRECGVSTASVSIAVFGESRRNRLASMLERDGLRLSGFEAVIAWLSRNWPEAVPTPAGVQRYRFAPVADVAPHPQPEAAE